MPENSKPLRLDKYLADMKEGTRTEVKQLIRKGLVTVDHQVTKDPGTKVDPVHSQVYIGNRLVGYVTFEYYMLYKPAGVVSATEDKRDQTVLDLIDSVRKDLFPVGRLDKDTEGLLLLTNDGDLSHRLLSPKKHVPKTYYARVEGIVSEKDVILFKNGLVVDDELTALPAKLKILQSSNISEIELTIEEGKFHQVKRMFEAVDKKVLFLKRLSMGSLVLDENLAPGEYRPLTNEEIRILKESK